MADKSLNCHQRQFALTAKNFIGKASRRTTVSQIRKSANNWLAHWQRVTSGIRKKPLGSSSRRPRRRHLASFAQLLICSVLFPLSLSTMFHSHMAMVATCASMCSSFPNKTPIIASRPSTSTFTHRRRSSHQTERHNQTKHHHRKALGTQARISERTSLRWRNLEETMTPPIERARVALILVVVSAAAAVVVRPPVARFETVKQMSRVAQKICWIMRTRGRDHYCVPRQRKQRMELCDDRYI